MDYLTNQLTSLLTPLTLSTAISSLSVGFGSVHLFFSLIIAVAFIYFVPNGTPKREQLPFAITLYYNALMFMGLFGGTQLALYALVGQTSVFYAGPLAWLAFRVFPQAMLNLPRFTLTLRNKVKNGDWSDEEKEMEKNRTEMLQLFRENWYKWDLSVAVPVPVQDSKC